MVTKVNAREGSGLTSFERDGRTCVTSDRGGLFASYIEELGAPNPQQALLKPAQAAMLTSQPEYNLLENPNYSVYRNYYKMYDTLI